MAEFTRMPSEFEDSRVMEELFRTAAVESLGREDKIKAEGKATQIYISISSSPASCLRNIT